MLPSRRVPALSLALLGTLAVVAAGGVAAVDAPAPAERGALPDRNAANLSVIHEGDAVTLHPQPQQVVKGTTALPPGRNVSVVLRSTDGETPFLMSETVAVTDDGRFAARFDLSDLDSPVQELDSPLIATVRIEAGNESTSVPVEVVEEPTATATTPDPTTTPAPDPATPTTVPGFGVTAAVLALLAVLALRRP